MKTIIVNGIEKQIEDTTLRLHYCTIVSLANKEAKHQPTVTFKDKANNQACTMTQGDWVFIRDGMIFNVANTGGA